MLGDGLPRACQWLQVSCTKPCTKLKVWGNFMPGQSGDPAWKWGDAKIPGPAAALWAAESHANKGALGFLGLPLFGSIRLAPFHFLPRFGLALESRCEWMELS